MGRFVWLTSFKKRVLALTFVLLVKQATWLSTPSRLGASLNPKQQLALGSEVCCMQKISWQDNQVAWCTILRASKDAFGRLKGCTVAAH